ncbi:MAG TPA: hypothetical protein VNE63_12595 [Candidatus Acidoferrales bacterium]|nr:hypothetical protein [Candidatus Acidoferrales bacterium]
MRTLLDHQRPQGLVASGDLAPFILVASGEQLRVEFREIPHLRHQHPVVAPKVAGLALDPAFFVRFVARAELALESPVRAERDEARGFLASEPTQDLLQRSFQVVVPEVPDDPAKILKRVFVSSEEGLLCRPMTGAM